jgi:hypothetical protein
VINLRQQQVTVKREALLEALVKGKQTHDAEYAQALDDYKAAVRRFLTEALERTDKGDYSDVTLRLPKPGYYGNEYINVIDMVKMSIDETFTIDGDSFRAYFRGEWSWRSTFEAASGSLKSYLES